jgi:FAD/FMN-containing dehydrogenase
MEQKMVESAETGTFAKAVGDLKKLLGESGWKEGSDVAMYLDDPRGRFMGRSNFVVLPKNVSEVSEIVKICSEYKLPLIPYGGGTGVVAGQLSIDNSDLVVVSLERMNKVREISAENSTLVAEAGCILANLKAAALEKGLIFPLGMASEGSCRIGGNLATNAGGIQVLRHGNARDLCVGIEAVLPDGSIFSELAPLRKNNTGYDLRHLLIGSEGTLGIITAATLTLKPAPQETVTLFAAIQSPSTAVNVLGKLRNDLGDSVDAIELMSDLGIQLVNRHLADTVFPLGETSPWYLLIEFCGSTGLREEVEQAIMRHFESGIISDVVIAESEAQRLALWRLREETPEANRREGAICSSDTSVPIGRIEEFIARVGANLEAIQPGLRVNSYGHIGDGNIHHNVFPPEGTSKADYVEQSPDNIEAVRMAINEATYDCNGSISAEHGIGRLKTNDLSRFADPAKLSVMKKIKKALDPDNIMNPGALFDR